MQSGLRRAQAFTLVIVQRTGHRWEQRRNMRGGGQPVRPDGWGSVRARVQRTVRGNTRAWRR